MKYYNYDIVFQEIPNEVTLAVNITQCPCKCKGCHSSYLQDDIGISFNEDTVTLLLERYGALITCFCFMGGDAFPDELKHWSHYLREHYPSLKIARYSGREWIPERQHSQYWDYVKVGPYIAECGPLKSPQTNQRLYRLPSTGEPTNITSLFWKS